MSETVISGKLLGFKDGGPGFSRIFISSPSSNGTRFPQDYESHDKVDLWVPDSVKCPGPGAMLTVKASVFPSQRTNRNGSRFPETLLIADNITEGK
tara:strand:- start:1705 stop:1992 length:288 start_codon:yes stop_codon:yes gene_type:complete